jgi:Secretion system C-terminal sorting domain
MKKRFLLLTGLFILTSLSASAQCTFVLPANTVIIQNDTVLVHCGVFPTKSYLICGEWTVTDSSSCTSDIHYYLDDMAHLTIDSGSAGSLAFISAYVKSTATYDANFSFRADTVYYTNGSSIEDTLGLIAAIDLGCVDFDYSLIGGNPCSLTSNSKPAYENLFSLFPNPASGQFSIEFAAGITPFQIQVQDMNGKIVFEKSGAEKSFQLNSSQWPSGIYSVHIYVEGRMASKRLVIQ